VAVSENEVFLLPVTNMYGWLVVSTHLKNSSQLGLLFPAYGKIMKNEKCSKPPTRWSFMASSVILICHHDNVGIGDVLQNFSDPVPVSARFHTNIMLDV